MSLHYRLCHIDALPDPGSKGFIVNGENIFAVKQRGKLYVYRNQCPHIGVALEWVEDQFLDTSKTMIQCANHGALFVIENGECVTGPCAGKSLVNIPFTIVDGYVELLTDNASVTFVVNSLFISHPQMYAVNQGSNIDEVRAMQNFIFHNPTHIAFGEGQIKQLAKLIPADARILLTYGGGSIKKNGVYDQVIAALKDRPLFEFGGIEPNPRYETLMRATAQVKENRLNYLLAVGGGSVIDGTKLIAAAVNFEGDPWDILAKHAPIKTALPLGCVLTLPATGTESNGNSVITRESTREKLSFGSPLVYPQFAILDPTTTYSLPARQMANGVVDAFVHIMEQYLTFPADAKVQDRFAEGLLLTLIEEGPRSLKEPTNYTIRANIMWAATMALNGLIGVGVPQDWATHMIGHEITALHGLDHAQTLAIVLPAVMQHQRQQKREKLLQYGRRVWNLQQPDEEQLIDATIEATRNFFEQMGTPTRLSAYGIESSTIATLVKQLEQHNLLKLGEHGDITLDASRRILELAA